MCKTLEMGAPSPLMNSTAATRGRGNALSGGTQCAVLRTANITAGNCPYPSEQPRARRVSVRKAPGQRPPGGFSEAGERKPAAGTKATAAQEGRGEPPKSQMSPTEPFRQLPRPRARQCLGVPANELSHHFLPSGKAEVSQWGPGKLRDHSRVGGCPHRQPGVAPAGRPCTPLPAVSCEPAGGGLGSHPSRETTMKNVASEHTIADSTRLFLWGDSRSLLEPGDRGKQRRALSLTGFPGLCGHRRQPALWSSRPMELHCHCLYPTRDHAKAWGG